MAHRGPGIRAVRPSGEEFVVARVPVANVSPQRELEGVGIELPGGGGPADPSRVLAAGVVGNGPSLGGRTARKQLAQPVGKLARVVLIGGPLALLGALAGPGSGRGIGEALSLRPLERRLLDQEALALVAPARPAEPDDDRAQGRVRAGAPGQGRIAAGEEDEVIEIRAGEAQAGRLPFAETAPWPARPRTPRRPSRE